MPEDPNIHPHWAAETKQLAAKIDRLDYYQVLGAEQTIFYEDLKEKYHTLQKNYHPDMFYRSPDLALRAAVLKISKRVAEAYVILRDPEKRAKYTRDIRGPDRAHKLRYSEQSEFEIRRQRDEELGRSTQGKQLVQKALAQLRAGDLHSAARDLKTALLFEKDNPAILQRLEEVEAELNDSSLEWIRPAPKPKTKPKRKL